MRCWSTRSGGGGACYSSTGRAERRCWMPVATTGRSPWLALFVTALLFPSSLGAATLTIGWEPSAGALAYRIYQSVDANPFSLVALTTNVQMSVTVADATNHWYVTATNLFGESDLSNVVTVGPGITPPPLTNPPPVIPPPTRLLVASVHGNWITLVWTPGDLKWSTRVERAPLQGAFSVIATVAPGTSQYQAMVRKNEGFAFRVRSCDGGTCSEPSAPVVVETR